MGLKFTLHWQMLSCKKVILYCTGKGCVIKYSRIALTKYGLKICIALAKFVKKLLKVLTFHI